MSEVISFRLNKDKTREARALKVLKRWQEKGHNIRYIVTEALLQLGDPDKNALNAIMLAQLNEKLDHVSQIFELIEHNKTASGIQSSQPISDTQLVFVKRKVSRFNIEKWPTSRPCTLKINNEKQTTCQE